MPCWTRSGILCSTAVVFIAVHSMSDRTLNKLLYCTSVENNCVCAAAANAPITMTRVGYAFGLQAILPLVLMVTAIPTSPTTHQVIRHLPGSTIRRLINPAPGLRKLTFHVFVKCKHLPTNQDIYNCMQKLSPEAALCVRDSQNFLVSCRDRPGHANHDSQACIFYTC